MDGEEIKNLDEEENVLSEGEEEINIDNTNDKKINDSVLTSIKKMLGITDEYEHFDEDILTNINMVLFTLNQIGVDSTSGIFIVDKNTTWSDVIPNEVDIGCIRTYVYLKVKLIFDPPLSSSALDAINRTINELEWRINIQVDSGVKNDYV